MRSVSELEKVLLVEIPLAAEMVLALDLNLTTDKTGDVGFLLHNTYIMHLPKFTIIHFC